MDQNLSNKNEQKPQNELDIIKNDQTFLKEHNFVSYQNSFQNEPNFLKTFIFDQLSNNHDKELFNQYPVHHPELQDYTNPDRIDIFNMCDGQNYVQNIFKGNQYDPPFMNMNHYQSNFYYNSGYEDVNSNNNLFKDIRGNIKKQQLFQDSEEAIQRIQIVQKKNQKIKSIKEGEYIEHKYFQKIKKQNNPSISLDKKIGGISSDQRKEKIKLYLQKRQRRTYTKKVSYDCRKKVADQRIRVKGRFVTKQQALKYLELNECEQNYSVDEIKKLINQRFAKKQQSQLKKQLDILSQKVKIQ